MYLQGKLYGRAIITNATRQQSSFSYFFTQYHADHDDQHNNDDNHDDGVDDNAASNDNPICLFLDCLFYKSTKQNLYITFYQHP